MGIYSSSRTCICFLWLPLLFIWKIKKRIFKHAPTPRSSLLDNSEPAADGYYNFVAISIITATLSLMVSNYDEHGYFVDLTVLYWLLADLYIGIGLWLSMSLFSYTVYFLRKAIVNGVSEDKVLPFYVLIQIIINTIPVYIVLNLNMSPVLAGGTMMEMCVHSMKIHSYWHTNRLLAREFEKERHNEDSPIAPSLQVNKAADQEYPSANTEDYPTNINIKDFTYFLMAPTLVYETYYPRTEKVDWIKVVQLSFAASISLFIFYVFMLELILPITKQALNINPIKAIIKLSLPTLALWCIGFYAVFHCILNLIAEVLRFADRKFYEDWWNAPTFDEWWKRWNVPVHEWMLRHIYQDSQRTLKLSRNVAGLATFLFSALLHEIVLTVAFGMVRPFLSTTMLLQIGLIFITRKSGLPNNLGNIFMWFSLFSGQPIVEILYSLEYVRLHSTP